MLGSLLFKRSFYYVMGRAAFGIKNILPTLQLNIAQGFSTDSTFKYAPNKIFQRNCFRNYAKMDVAFF